MNYFIKISQSTFCLIVHHFLHVLIEPSFIFKYHTMSLVNMYTGLSTYLFYRSDFNISFSALSFICYQGHDAMK